MTMSSLLLSNCPFLSIPAMATLIAPCVMAAEGSRPDP